MTSYLVYAIASMRQYPGFSTKDDRRLVPVWDNYYQLIIDNQRSHFRRVNDVAFVVWKCMFDKGLKKKKLLEAAYNYKVSFFGCVFLQFSNFTYICIGCFTGEPFMLPRYPSDKIILMELCRQLIHVHERQSQAYKTSLKFLESIGRYSVLTNPKAKNMEDEMQWVTMRRFKAHDNFDFRGMKNKIKRSYTHVYRLEDAWVDCEAEEDVRRMGFSCLTLEQIEKLNLARIPDAMEDIDDIVDPVYFE